MLSGRGGVEGSLPTPLVVRPLKKPPFFVRLPFLEAAKKWPFLNGSSAIKALRPPPLELNGSRELQLFNKKSTQKSIFFCGFPYKYTRKNMNVLKLLLKMREDKEEKRSNKVQGFYSLNKNLTKKIIIKHFCLFP